MGEGSALPRDSSGAFGPRFSASTRSLCINSAPRPSLSLKRDIMVGREMGRTGIVKTASDMQVVRFSSNITLNDSSGGTDKARKEGHVLLFIQLPKKILKFLFLFG